MKLASLLLPVPLALAQTSPVKVISPNGDLEVSFAAAGETLTYEVSFRGKTVIRPSALGLDIQGQPVLGERVRIVSSQPSSVDETYSVVHGKSNPVRNRANTLVVELQETERMRRRLSLEARAYDDGAAFRYVVPDQRAIKELRLVNEKTEFLFAKDATTWPLFLTGFRTSYEDDYHTLPLSGIHRDSLIALPLLAEVPGVAWVAITEAHIDNYAGMYLSRVPTRAGGQWRLEARLAPRADWPGLAVTGQTPVVSPWRVLMIADDAGRLIESNLVINLNPPPAISDTSWIQAGKTAWDWWSGSYAKDVSFKPGMNTATMKHYIDFAARSGLEYMLVDAGWAARGTGPNDSGADLTQTIPAIDMPAILEHARAKNVKVWLWAHWTDIERQMDQVFPLFEKWGVAGVKIDFMDRDDQWMVNFYRRVVKKAAEHRLMIDFHGAYKPDGLRRTYPNLMTREGVMGLEYTKWSARITPDHNVILPFTRMLAGPMDYTPGAFDNVTKEEFQPRSRMPMAMGTRAHQLALFVIYESPLQMVVDYPEAYDGQKEFAFIQAVPATWDETRVLKARVGDYITIARRRGQEWYIGSITGWRANEYEVPLDLLGSGQFAAEIYSDAPDAAAHPKRTTIERRQVNASARLAVKMVSGGGQAVRIRPASSTVR